MQRYVPPRWQAKAFNCPHCGVLAKQEWAVLYLDSDNPMPEGDFHHLHKDDFFGYYNLRLSICDNCHKESIWHGTRLFYPSVEGVEPPNPDLSDEIKADYLEAGAIVQRSPRGAAALLRLCLQKLCKQLGQPGKHLDTDIAALVRTGLPVQIQQALDAVRVIGNNAVHPGQLDLKDDIATAMTLFGLINLIADNRISEPKRIAAVYNTLPEGARKAIERRDNNQ